MRCKNCLTEIDGAVCPNCGSPASELSETEQNEIDEMEEAFWRSIRESVEESPQDDNPIEEGELPRDESPEEEGELPREESPEEEGELPQEEELPQGEEIIEAEAAKEEAAYSVEGTEPEEETEACQDIETDWLEDVEEVSEEETEAISSKPNRYDLLEQELSQNAERRQEETETVQRKQKKQTKHRDDDREKASRQKTLMHWMTYVNLICVTILVAFSVYAIVRAIRGNPISLNQNTASSSVAYVKSDGTLWMSEDGITSSRKLAENVEQLIDCDIAEDTYLYMDQSGTLYCLTKGKLHYLGEGMSPYDIYGEESLSAVSYVIYDETAATYDAFVWVQGMEEARQVEYDVPYVEHFRYSDDGETLVYSVQNMTGSHMIKLLKLKEFSKALQGAGQTVYYAGDDYLTCYDVWGSNDSVLYYDYEQDGMCVCSGTETVELVAGVQSAYILEESHLLVALLNNGSVWCYPYRQAEVSGTQLAPSLGAIDKLELVSDAYGIPRLLVLWQEDTGYGVLAEQLAGNGEGETLAPIKLFEGYVSQIRTDGTWVSYLCDGMLMSQQLLNPKQERTPVVEAENVSSYEMSGNGRLYWKDESSGMLLGRKAGNGKRNVYMGNVVSYQVIGDDMYFCINNGKLFGYYNKGRMYLVDEEVAGDSVMGTQK